MPEAVATLDLTRSWLGYAALAIFAIAYLLVIFEETIHLRKSKPVLVAAGLIWLLIGMGYTPRVTPRSHMMRRRIRLPNTANCFSFFLWPSPM